MINKYKQKEIIINKTTTVNQLKKELNYNDHINGFIVIQNSYFNPEIYEYLCSNKWLIYINNNLSRAVKVFNKLYPPFPNFIIKARGIVINDDKILMVKELNNNYYSLPGGSVNGKETPEQGVIREVIEETNIYTETIELIYTDNKECEIDHNSGCITYYYLLKPLNDDIVVQKSELKDAIWIPLNDYLNNHYSNIHIKDYLMRDYHI